MLSQSFSRPILFFLQSESICLFCHVLQSVVSQPSPCLRLGGGSITDGLSLKRRILSFLLRLTFRRILLLYWLIHTTPSNNRLESPAATLGTIAVVSQRPLHTRWPAGHWKLYIYIYVHAHARLKRNQDRVHRNIFVFFASSYRLHVLISSLLLSLDSIRT